MKKKQISSFVLLSLSMLMILNCSPNLVDTDFSSNLPTDTDRTWIGAEYWANPLQDWQLHAGRIECRTGGGNRNIFLLTHELAADLQPFAMSVQLGSLEKQISKIKTGWAGFSIGVRGEFNDYRDNAVRGIGLQAGLTTTGKLFIGCFKADTSEIKLPLNNIKLQLQAGVVGDVYKLTLSAFRNDSLLAVKIRSDVDPDWLRGGVSLVCSNDLPVKEISQRPEINDGNRGFRPGTRRGGRVRFWFSDWRLAGGKVRYFPERTYGPINFVQYTLSKNIMKMTAQLSPVGENDGRKVILEIRNKSGWKQVNAAVVDPFARTAAFRIENWNSNIDIPYRLGYSCPASDGVKQFSYKGIIRKEPLKKNEIVVAAFTGNNDLGFPNTDIVSRVEDFDPDLLFFSGDQIYEGVGGYGAQRTPLDMAFLDYLRKWYIFGWTWGDLMRDRPTVSIPDDHDVYHGNLWGAGGAAVPAGMTGARGQDAGGYKMPAVWVNMVQKTQTSHLPDPYDPSPVKQGIGVYYCDLNYGGISFAIIEDRKFKSAPKRFLPKADIQNGWARNRKFDASVDGDVEGAVLLGERQLSFLHQWAIDWQNKTWMKVCLSQTIFANVATLPREEAYSDAIVPRLRILKSGEYPPNDIPVSDMDSNGWPQTGRNKAVAELRRGFAFHIAGDQHLGSTIQYGIDNWGDAGWAFCVPSVSNVWPRRWYPFKGGKNRKPDEPKYTGDFKDGFGNKISVKAISNPLFTGLKPARLYDRATGFGIVRFNRKSRDIVIECWPRLSNQQYADWPLTINQVDNYNRVAAAFLPEILITGIQEPLIQIISDNSNEIVYTLRLNSNSIKPGVFAAGYYSILIGEPGTENMKRFNHIHTIGRNAQKKINVSF